MITCGWWEGPAGAWVGKESCNGVPAAHSFNGSSKAALSLSAAAQGCKPARSTQAACRHQIWLPVLQCTICMRPCGQLGQEPERIQGCVPCSWP